MLMTHIHHCCTIAIGVVLGLGAPQAVILLVTAGIKALERPPQMVEGLALGKGACAGQGGCALVITPQTVVVQALIVAGAAADAGQLAKAVGLAVEGPDHSFVRCDPCYLCL